MNKFLKPIIFILSLMIQAPLSSKRITLKTNITPICQIYHHRKQSVNKLFRVVTLYTGSFEYTDFVDGRCGAIIPDLYRPLKHADRSVIDFDKAVSLLSLPRPSFYTYNIDATVRYKADPQQRGGGGFVILKVWHFKRVHLQP
jgi:hypothetical protein